jgi:tetratricopeptide (TPR) repeat protein
MTAEGLREAGTLEVGAPDVGALGPKPRKIRGVVLIGTLALGLLGAGAAIGYLIYTKVDLTLQGLQTAYVAEQSAAKRLTRKTEELSKALEQAQSRVKALEDVHKVSEDERSKLEARTTKLENATQGLQTAFAAEQATSRRTAQRTEELAKSGEDTQAQVRTLDAIQKAWAQEKSALEARAGKLEAMVQTLQTASAAEQVKSAKLTQKTEELSKALEEVHARMKTRDKKPGDLAASNYALGLSYSERAMHEEARRAFQTALKFDPNHAESHLELARLYLGHFEDKPSAVPHLRRYLQLKPAGEDSERVKGWLLRVEKELEANKDRQGWGNMDRGQGLKRVFE